MRNAYKFLVGKSEGKKPLGRPSIRRTDNITMGVREVGSEVVDRMPVVGSCEHGNEH
jgi:hypothetical protein